MIEMFQSIQTSAGSLKTFYEAVVIGLKKKVYCPVACADSPGELVHEGLHEGVGDHHRMTPPPGRAPLPPDLTALLRIAAELLRYAPFARYSSVVWAGAAEALPTPPPY